MLNPTLTDPFVNPLFDSHPSARTHHPIYIESSTFAFSCGAGISETMGLDVETLVIRHEVQHFMWLPRLASQVLKETALYPGQSVTVEFVEFGFIRMHTDRHVATIGTKNQYRMQVRLCYSVSEMNFGAEFQPKKNTLFPCRGTRSNYPYVFIKGQFL
ncbi:uncharacterized protein H6S33_010597 [Morchella sextelata]|uniref:uncharacterized protein n=1 Tax=Morchella sextelata TaxID=1174677 RepID=UPI001D0590FE|nr:uncharacterized protein H6S33_010597 [Morchella sextelata]KAH0611332.1 hypothetical protein H6S33_010597 [Morchella sextelata]